MIRTHVASTEWLLIKQVNRQLMLERTISPTLHTTEFRTIDMFKNVVKKLSLVGLACSLSHIRPLHSPHLSLG
jgi:hypothetical protein